MRVVHLVRHTAVAAHWAGRCYGASDVGLSRDGRGAARTLAAELARLAALTLYVSPLRRARFLGALVARETPVGTFVVEPRLAECNFGGWEGLTWDQIYAASGDAMMGLVRAPASFRPGGTGETTFEMRDRAMAWLEDVRIGPSPALAICHGGPIAAIRGSLSASPVADWPGLVPRYGEVVTVEL